MMTTLGCTDTVSEMGRVKVALMSKVPPDGMLHVEVGGKALLLANLSWKGPCH